MPVRRVLPTHLFIRMQMITWWKSKHTFRLFWQVEMRFVWHTRSFHIDKTLFTSNIQHFICSTLEVNIKIIFLPYFQPNASFLRGWLTAEKPKVDWGEGICPWILNHRDGERMKAIVCLCPPRSCLMYVNGTCLCSLSRSTCLCKLRHLFVVHVPAQVCVCFIFHVVWHAVDW